MAEKPVFPVDQVVQTSLTSETVFAENGVVSRTLFANSVTRVVLFAFAAGQSLSEHSTPRAAIVQVLSGSCEFDVNGKTHNLTAGDLLHMPPGAPHAVRAAEKFSMLLTLSKP
ncbi:MAG: cupin domain-containing protein [Nibricoccus sp.]